MDANALESVEVWAVAGSLTYTVSVMVQTRRGKLLNCCLGGHAIFLLPLLLLPVACEKTTFKRGKPMKLRFVQCILL